MKRLMLNMVAALAIVGGGAYLTAPAPLSADPVPVCCDGAGDSRCCGEECKATQEGCTACVGWRCIFF